MPKNMCEIFTSEYRYQYIEKKQDRVPISYPYDCFAERIEPDWQIDPRKATLRAEINADSEELAHRLILDNLRTVYQVSYKNPATRSIDDDYSFASPSATAVTKESKKSKKPKGEDEKDFGSELIAHLQRIYFNPHTEKISAPPVTAKRVFGYMRPRLLHGNLSAYQDVHGRTGGEVILRNAELVAAAKRRQALKARLTKNTDQTKTADDPCKPVANS